MSKTLRYDSLLVHALASAFAERYSGSRARAIRFDDDARTLSISFARHALVWDFDPAGGGLWSRPERGTVSGIILPRATKVADVRAALDDRVLEWVLRSKEGDDARELVLRVELLPNRRTAVLVDRDGRVMGGLGRGNVASDHLAHESPASARAGADRLPDLDTFTAVLRDTEPARRERALTSTFAWTGPINAGPILGQAMSRVDGEALAAAWERYVAVVNERRPGIVAPGELDQPYPAPLPGLAFRETVDLLAAFEAVAPIHRTRAAGLDPAEVLRSLERLCDGERSKIKRLRDELEGAARQADLLRRDADLLLAQLHRVRRGMSEVTLDDWAGGQVDIALDPSLDAAANANRMYERARKRERAARRLPRLIALSTERLERFESAASRLAEAPSTATEAAALIPASSAPGPRTRDGPSLPYRRYRTSGGLEVRVGRGSKANDELTLHHSSPEDVWLHARDVAGAHVVLRWGRRDDNPPAADIAEAAILAALHSRARTSGTVPVDWTRRKYVRKPRKARPGLVTLDRARTLFVEPDPRVEERLRL